MSSKALPGWIRPLYPAVLLAIGMIAGCAPEPYVYKPITLERAAPSAESQQPAGSEATAGRPAYEALKPPTQGKARTEKKLPPREPFDAKRITLTQGDVAINCEKMPLSDFVIHALGETLKVAFVMDDKTMNDKQPVTLRMPKPLPAVKALEIVMGLLETYNFYLEERAGAVYILQKSPAPKAPFDVKVGYEASDSEVDILQVVPLKHIRINEIDPLLKDMFKGGVQVKPYKDNILLLYGRAFQMKPILEFIETFDVPSLQNKNSFLIRLTYWQTDEFITQVSKILESSGFTIARSPREAGVLFMPIKQLNSILVVSPDESTSKYVLEWKEKLDTAEAAGTEEKTFTYVPLYSRASLLVESINKLYGVLPATDAAQKAAAARPATAAALPGMKIAADDNKNIIVVACAPSVYKNILNLLKGLDTPMKQVLIEATIAELTLTDELRYGLEWYLQNSVEGGQYTVGTLGQLGLKSLGLTATIVNGAQNFKAMLNAFATTNKANILSTPRLTVLDNTEATIQVGQDVPIVSAEVTASDIQRTTTSAATTPSILRNIQYRSTGVILRVKPTINTEGLLTLNISQEVSDTGAAGIGDSPIILMRRINTSVVVGHGQTIALGGLIKESKGTALTKIPLLGDIPLIGHLFKVTSESKSRTELLVLVTPTILTNTGEAAQITDQLKKELKWFK
jgi:general secretion pathway protein D